MDRQQIISVVSTDLAKLDVLVNTMDVDEMDEWSQRRTVSRGYREALESIHTNLAIWIGGQRIWTQDMSNMSDPLIQAFVVADFELEAKRNWERHEHFDSFLEITEQMELVVESLKLLVARAE